MPINYIYYINLKLNRVYKVMEGSDEARNLSWMSKDHMARCDEKGNVLGSGDLVVEVELENPPEEETSEDEDE